MLLRTISSLSGRSNREECGPTKYMSRLLQDFELGESLGAGGFGEIIKARHRCDGNDVAIKIIKFKSNNEDLKRTKREANTLAKLSHKNIVRYFNSWIETARVPVEEYQKLNFEDSEESVSSEIKKLSQNGYINNDNGYIKDDDVNDDEECDDFIEFASEEDEFIDLNYLCIHMELCDKRTLRSAIDDNLYLKEERLDKYFQEICEGLGFMHQNNIVHRDLKPENIFLTRGDVIKIGDFGLSKQISLENHLAPLENGDSELVYGSLTAPCGTSIYIAPEFFLGAFFSIKSDIFSLGVTYFEMCSKPMTEMEKSKIFPLSSQRLNCMNLSPTKKILLKSLLNLNDRERPTCEHILKILNSEKSVDQIKEIIKESRKVPYIQFKAFQRSLQGVTVLKTELVNFVITEATKIFELHAGRNIPVPTFLPSLNFPDNLTILLNTQGNSISISNTSRIGFAYYAAHKKIKKMRRFSTGKIFKEGYFAPIEASECLFQIISPEANDHVTSAEILHVASEIFEKIFPDDKIRIFINHSCIYSSILQHCKITDEEASLFTQFCSCLPDKFLRCNLLLRLHSDVEKFLEKMLKSYRIEDCDDIISLIKDNEGKEMFARIIIGKIRSGFEQIKSVVAVAEKFGIKSESIHIYPLLVNHQHSRGVTFKIWHDSGTEIASGGNFDNLIWKCYNPRHRNDFNLTAVDISLNLYNIVPLLNLNNLTKTVDVEIFAEDKSLAVPIFKDLISRGIRSEIVSSVVLSDKPNQRPSIVIKLSDEKNGVVYKVQETGMRQSCTVKEISRGMLRSDGFLEFLARFLKGNHRGGLPELQ